MSEPLRIVCRCGYENWVAPEKRGQTVPCFICGDDIVVESAEESPPSSESPAFSDPSTESTLSTRLRPRSPFEADDSETPARKVQPAPPPATSAPPPMARPRNPFEADDAEQASPFRPSTEKTFVADPFSRELIAVPKPPPSTADEMEKYRPSERRNRHMVIDTISPHDAPTGEKCMQCGRPIRGSWDRMETHQGVFCYVCSNQGTQDIPDRVKAGSGKNAELRERDMLLDPADIRNAAPLEQHVGITGAPGFKKFILWMAWGVLAITFIVWLTGWGGSTSYTGGYSEDPVDAVRVPAAFRYIGWSIHLLGAVIGGILALYLTLDRNGRLPHERFLLNFVNLSAGIVLLIIIAAGIVFVRVVFVDDPIIGLLYSMISGLFFIGCAFYVLTGWFDFGVGDYLWLAFFYMPMVQGLVQGVTYFLLWGVQTVVAG